MNNVYIKNPEELEHKILQIKQDGAINLHIIADFDNTLTKANFNGIKFQSAFAQIRTGKYLGEKYSLESKELFEKYHPIELDKKIGLDEKISKMNEWWIKHLDLFIKYNLNKSILDEIINKNKLVLRDKAKEFFALLNNNNIPILIFSAGFGDLIKQALTKNDCLFDNMSVISNFFVFSDTGVIIGYNPLIVHSFNKGEIAIKNDPHFNKIKEKKNIILLGDNEGDLSMADGLKHNIKISIGFYNNEDKKDLHKYLEFYDVVITDDSDMSYVIDLLKRIL